MKAKFHPATLVQFVANKKQAITTRYNGNGFYEVLCDNKCWIVDENDIELVPPRYRSPTILIERQGGVD